MTKGEQQQMRKTINEILAVHTNIIANLIESVAGDFVGMSAPQALRHVAKVLRQTSNDLNSPPKEDNDAFFPRQHYQLQR